MVTKKSCVLSTVNVNTITILIKEAWKTCLPQSSDVNFLEGASGRQFRSWK